MSATGVDDADVAGELGKGDAGMSSLSDKSMLSRDLEDARAEERAGMGVGVVDTFKRFQRVSNY